ncbi:prolipoprotein diacylglyceryl transferase [Tepiditoga spiralis]|uniref:Phosphatidylglycerol--prolipoprotein diacylglyceryl transferase n=2 Tax=Tepiditoga spiralis TaxID=2108365 RepID=A0A7G1G923_9BACT|nr:prolipoprotein diacylglyceryl transferase [Tepiditoga spiralis]
MLAVSIAEKQAKKEKILENDFFGAIIFGIIFGIIGARLYYVTFNWNYFSQYPTEIIKTWHGGMAIHGGVLGSILAAYIYTKRKKCSMKFLQSLDLFTFVLPLAQAIGRWGNFMNHEAYGGPTELPWKMFIALKDRMPGYESYSYFHPTFLYESILDLSIFLFLLYYIRNKRNSFGEVTALYLILYSIGRGFIETLRTDSLMIFGMKTAVLISFILSIIGIVMFIYIKKKENKK